MWNIFLYVVIKEGTYLISTFTCCTFIIHVEYSFPTPKILDAKDMTPQHFLDWNIR